MSEQVGKKTWVFPDGEMPLPGKFPVKGHESIIILNPSDEPAICKLSCYDTDREPYSDIVVRVEPRRVRSRYSIHSRLVDKFKFLTLFWLFSASFSRFLPWV